MTRRGEEEEEEEYGEEKVQRKDRDNKDE